MTYKGIFKNRYPSLQGKDWLKRIDPEDQKAFYHIGFTASDYGKKGGKARSQTAKRDNRGRFASNK